MRYGDGPAVEVETTIAAPPAVVWALVRDPATPTRFSDELQEVRWIDDLHFAGRNHHPAIGDWETVCTVVTDDPGRRFGWVVGEPEEPSAQWRFTLEPAEDGRVTLRQWMKIGPAPSGLSAAIEAMPDKEDRIIARRLEEHRANMQRTVDGIRALAEDA